MKGLEMKKMFTLGAAIVLLAISGAVMAYPSLTGPTGSGVLPNAATVAPQAFDVAIDYLDLYDSVLARVNFGLTENTEVGVAYTEQDGPNSWGLNAKRTMSVNERVTGAIGAIYQDWDGGNSTQVYGVLGTTLPVAGIPAVKGCIGLNYTNVDSGSNYDALRGFVSLSASVTEKLSIAVDFQTEDSYFDDKPLSSIVARYPINTRMNAQIGMSNAMSGISGGMSHNLFVGVNMGFGGQGM